MVDGQLTFTNEINHIATVAIPVRDPTFILSDVAFWLIAILASIVSFVPIVEPEMAATIASGVGAFSAAGIQQASYTLEPRYVCCSNLTNLGSNLFECIVRPLASTKSFPRLNIYEIPQPCFTLKHEVVLDLGQTIHLRGKRMTKANLLCQCYVACRPLIPLTC